VILLEMLNLINIGSTVANRRNLVDPIQRANMRGLMAEFDSRWIICFHLFFIFIYNFFSAYFQYYPGPFLFFNFFSQKSTQHLFDSIQFRIEE
jgi:hypothetical protein